MNGLPPISVRERWLYEKVLPGVWGGSCPLILMGSIIPACVTGNYWWLVLTLLAGLLLYFSGKKLSRYTFLYQARMTKADWKRLDEQIRDSYQDPFEDFMTIAITFAIIAIITGGVTYYWLTK